MRTIYICAPLAGDIEANVNRVLVAVRKLSDEYRGNGIKSMPMLIAPHLALNGITFNKDGETDRKWGMECCLGLLRWADEVIVIGDHITAGMAEEMETAFRMGITVTRRSDL